MRRGLMPPSSSTLVVVLLLLAVQHAGGQACTCSDIAPSEFYTCVQQKSLGQCKAISGAAPNVPEGFCQQTCGRCSCTAGSTPSTASPKAPTSSPSQTTQPMSAAASKAQSTAAPCTCTDTQPGSSYTCAQQKAFGKCSDSFVSGKGNCQITCGQCQCNPACKCEDVQPPGSFTCAQQKAFGQCSADFMKKGSTAAPNGFCRITCGACSCQASAPPSSSPVPSSSSTSTSTSTSTPPCACTDTPPDSSYTCTQQKDFGQCSAGFMTKMSPTNPNGYCARTCGRCNCPAAPTSQTQSSPSSSPRASPNSPGTTSNSPRASSNSPGTTSNSPRSSPGGPVAVPSSPSTASRAPSAAGTAQAPPQPLSAAFAANCDCSDVPPDGTTCAVVLSSGRCPTFGVLVGNQAHPEGFCQKTCNRCGNYCVPKSGGSIPAGSKSSGRSSSPSSGRGPPASSGNCSDNPPNGQYSCAQQRSFGKCNESFMTKGNFCRRTCGRCT